VSDSLADVVRACAEKAAIVAALGEKVAAAVAVLRDHEHEYMTGEQELSELRRRAHELFAEQQLPPHFVGVDHRAMAMRRSR
jgi:hypothetical protein